MCPQHMCKVSSKLETVELGWSVKLASYCNRTRAFASSQRLASVSWGPDDYFIISHSWLLVRGIRSFVLPVLKYWSAVWCSAIDTYLWLLDCVDNGASFLAAALLLFLLLLLLLLLLKKIGNARPGEGDCHPISPKTPAPHYQPIEEKKRKGK